MKWKRQTNGDWVAKGEEGDFLVWRLGRVWCARYRSVDKKYMFHLPRRGSVDEAKKLCEGNRYWE